MLTAVVDENGSSYLTFGYDSAGNAVLAQASSGVNKFTFQYASGMATVTDPLGTQRVLNFQTVADVQRVGSTSQPGGSGCGPSSSASTYDANGNLSTSVDFNGNAASYTYDLSRNLETQRVEAQGTAASRTVTNVWHPDWRVPVMSAEPKKVSHFVYNGQPDPFNNGVLAACAPSNAVLENGKPIAVLCKKVEQATTDANGSQGFGATVTGTPRVWQWTYNADGQVLTATGPRVDVVDTTTYVYRTADDTATPMQYRRGDPYSVTDALGHTTTMPQYDGNGRVTMMVDPNGLTTTMTYSPRGWLTSRTVTGNGVTETTSYTYDAVGQLLKVTQPDGSYIAYAYDAAHRMTDVSDGLNNTIHYTLDAMGNRVQEQVNDPSGVLAQNISRSYDALNRLQTVTGALQ